MKKINLILGVLAFASLGISSCSSDDDNNNSGTVGIAGTYKLSEANTGTDTDFNQDGTAHANQMLESDCYNNSKIVFNSDNTFTYDMKRIIVDVAAGTSACSETTVNGTWEIYAGSGTTAVINATYKDANQEDVTLTIAKQGNELSIYNVFSQYPNRNDAGGAIYSTGDFELVFVRQ